MATFTQEQLNQAKTLLEGGKLFFQMKEDMGIEQDQVRTLREEMIDAFGRDDLMPLIQAARQNRQANTMTFERLPNRIKAMNLTDAAKIDEMIANLQATIVELNTVKAGI